MSFSDCQWYSNLGFGPASGGDKYCLPNCPSDRVRIAMDTRAAECTGGGKVSCCVPSYMDTIEVENEKLGIWRDEMSVWLKDPTCGNPGIVLQRRSGPGEHAVLEIEQGLQLAGRATAPFAAGELRTEGLLLALLTKASTSNMISSMETIWNNGAGTVWSGLRFPGFRSYATNLSAYRVEGPIEFSHDVICSPYYWNAMAQNGGGTKKLDCSECSVSGGCTVDNTDDGGSDSPAPDSFPVRRAESGNARSYSVNLRSPTGQTASLSITLPSYPGFDGDDIDEDDPMRDQVLDFLSALDCGNTYLDHYTTPSDTVFQMEHPLDGNLMARFMEDAAAGRLRSGAVATHGAISLSFFRTARTMPLPLPPPLPGGQNLIRLYDRVMECLGSRFNTAIFVGLQEFIHEMKTALMQGHDPIARGRWAALTTDADNPGYVLTRLRASITVIEYLDRESTPDVNGFLATIVNNVGTQWDYGAGVYNAANPNDISNIGDFWREWARDFFMTFLPNHVRGFVTELIAEMRTFWNDQTGDQAEEVLEVLRELEGRLDHLTINTARFH
jgi:chitinase